MITLQLEIQQVEQIAEIRHLINEAIWLPWMIKQGGNLMILYLV